MACFWEFGITFRFANYHPNLEVKKGIENIFGSLLSVSDNIQIFLSLMALKTFPGIRLCLKT